ncbi:MAG TPA: YfbM family protein [Bryobacteraceae bacterium]|nr:YfbM family protein [Bryobacteraceae bacterium]
MMGEFVQVSPALLARLKADPDLIEQLLQPPAASPLPKQVSPAVQQRLPQALAAVMQRYDPAVQQQLAARLGVSAEALRRGEGGADLLARVFAMRAASQQSEPVEGRGAFLSIDKAWHGIHYLLSGETEPGRTLLSQAVLGGTEIGEDITGYGPARYFDAGRVAEISQELSRADLENEMAARFDPARMSQLQIYPFGWEPSALNWLLEEHRKLAGFYAAAASQKLAMVAWLA